MGARIESSAHAIASAWASVLERRAGYVLLVFFVSYIVGLIASAVSVRIDSNVPALFPQDHSQAIARGLFRRFDEAALKKTAASPTKHQAHICDVATIPTQIVSENCHDADVSCGAWAAIGECERNADIMQEVCPRSCGFCSYCLAQRCGVSQPPTRQDLSSRPES